MSTPRFRDRQPYVHFECERHVYVVRSHISGYGLFGKNNIRRNPSHSIVCLYSGKLVRHTEMSDSNSNTWRTHIDRVWGIDVQDEMNLSVRWSNHSLHNNDKIVIPNDGMTGYIMTVGGRIKMFCILIQTIRDIDPNEEITLDYCRTYWSDYRRGRMYPPTIIHIN